MNSRPHNWATNTKFRATRYHEPETVEELQEIVRQTAKVRVVGTGHSFNDVADTTGTLVSLNRLDKGIAIDPTRHTATVNAGITYIELAPLLQREGYALKNMASLPHISVMGAAATATHGSGDKLGNLASHICGLDMINANGDLVQLSGSEQGERFDGMVVSLGGLGVVTKVTLELVPTYNMQQQVYEKLPWPAVQSHFDEIMASGDSVSLFTDWRDKSVNQVWIKQVVPGDDALPVAPEYLGATLATVDHHPVDEYPSEPCTEQRGIPGLWFERLPHFHIRSTLTGGNELQTEYFVPRAIAVDALTAVESLQERMAPFLTISEVRSVAADDLWMSTAYGMDCIGIHFSWQNRWPEVARFLPVLEEHLAPYQARPHWGKLFSMSTKRLHALYPRMDDFCSLLKEWDPERKFSNAYIVKYIWNGSEG